MSYKSQNQGELKPPKPPWYLHLKMASEAISEHLISKISWGLCPHTLLYSFLCLCIHVHTHHHTHVTPLLEILAMGLMTFFSFCYEGVLGWYYLLTTHAAVGIYHIIRLRKTSFFGFVFFAFSFVCLFVSFFYESYAYNTQNSNPSMRYASIATWLLKKGRLLDTNYLLGVSCRDCVGNSNG